MMIIHLQVLAAVHVRLEPGKSSSCQGDLRQGACCWHRKHELCARIQGVTVPVALQVKSGIFGKDLEKVSEYGAQEYPGVSPVCLLFSGCHYDLLMQVLQ